MTCLGGWTSVLKVAFLVSLLGGNGCQTDGAGRVTVDGQQDVDVCVYAATPAGITAAVALKREGRSVMIVEPSRWVGGALGSGIKPRQDCPNMEAVGGMTRELLNSLGVRWEGQLDREISPREVREDFLKLLRRHGIEVIYEHRIDRCVKDDREITEAIFDLAPFDPLGCPPPAARKRENLRIRADIFIDASYEGDLMARAGVSSRTGRESELDYGEEGAGVREPGNLTPIDPFQESGNPASGLLKGVEAGHGKPLGSGDRYTQAYNFRYYVTSELENRLPIDPPDDYDPRDYELVGRYVDYLKESAGSQEDLLEKLGWIFPGWRNAGEYNYQRRSLITMAPVGISHLYATGDYATRARIWKQHQDYLRGLHYFLSTDPRVPGEFRERTAALGLDRRHHPDTHGYPHQLYVRVARRLVGRYTITAHDVYNRTSIGDPVGLAQYGIDTYPSRRIWLQGNGQVFVAVEGEMFIGGSKGPTNVPYPIAYRALTPLAHECTNLLVPVCFSATHLGYASARMEPVFMICGESAGVAAAQSLEEGCPVQDIDMDRYLTRLKELGQKLRWDTEDGS